MRELNRIWRFFATAFCFAAFGIGGLLLALFWLPLFILVESDPKRRQRACRRTIHKVFGLFVKLMEFVGVLRVHAKDVDKLRSIKGKIVIANHPSLIDVVVLISYIENANCVVKEALWRNPFIRGILKNTGYLSNVNFEHLLAESKRSMDEGDNLIIFPEGTRTAPGQSPVFQRGAANLAVRTGKNFQRVLIKVTPPGLTKGLPWYKVPSSKINLILEVKDEFDVQPYMVENVSKSIRGLTKDIQNVFVEELQQS